MAHHRESYDTEASPIERFFASYYDFPYNPSQPSAEQFQSMRRSYGWRRGDAEGESAWAGFRLALVKEFNWLFGTDEHDLLAWQNVCAFVGVPGRFETSNECIRILKDRYFNLIDLIDTRRRGSGVAQAFPTKEALQQYARRTASYFPYDHPKAGNLLRRLLRRKPRQIIISNASKSPFFPPSSLARDGRAKAKERNSHAQIEGAPQDDCGINRGCWRSVRTDLVQTAKCHQFNFRPWYLYDVRSKDSFRI